MNLTDYHRDTTHASKSKLDVLHRSPQGMRADNRAADRKRRHVNDGASRKTDAAISRV